MRIKEIMTSETKYIPTTANIKEAAVHMREVGTGFLPIADEESNKIAGVLTDRDIVIRGLANNTDLENTSVDKIMSKDVFYCMEDETVEKAVESMKQQRVRRLIVLDKDKNLAGILALGDMATSLKDETLIAKVLGKISE